MISKAEQILIFASLEEMERCLKELNNCVTMDARSLELITAAVTYVRDNKAMDEAMNEEEPKEAM